MDEAASAFFVDLDECPDESSHEFGAWAGSSTAFVVADDRAGDYHLV